MEANSNPLTLPDNEKPRAMGMRKVRFHCHTRGQVIGGHTLGRTASFMADFGENEAVLYEDDIEHIKATLVENQLVEVEDAKRWYEESLANFKAEHIERYDVEPDDEAWLEYKGPINVPDAVRQRLHRDLKPLTDFKVLDETYPPPKTEEEQRMSSIANSTNNQLQSAIDSMGETIAGAIAAAVTPKSGGQKQK